MKTKQSNINTVFLGIVMTMLLILPFLGKAQEVTVSWQGMWKVYKNDVYVSQHSTERGATGKVLSLMLQDKNADIYATLPEKMYLTIENFDVPLMVPGVYDVQDVEITSISSTSAAITVTYDKDPVSEFYIEFYKPGGEIVQTNRSTNRVTSLDQLEPNTEYYFRVYIVLSEFKVVTSNIYNFKTLQDGGISN